MSNTAKFLDDFKEQFIIKEEGDSVKTDESPVQPTEKPIEDSNENDSEQGQVRPNTGDSEGNGDGRNKEGRNQEGLLEPTEEEDGAESDSVSYVPSFVLKAEKDKRRELEKKLEDLQRVQPQPSRQTEPEIKTPQPEPEIDYYTDPDAWYKRQIEVQENRINQLNESIQEQRAQNQVRELNAAINDSIARESATIPDLNDALDYLFKAQYKSRVLLHGDDEETARRHIQLNVMQLSALALEKGKTPARMLYEAAQALNYTPTKGVVADNSQKERKKATVSQLSENIKKNTGFSGSSGSSSAEGGEIEPFVSRLGLILKDKKEYQKAKDIIRKARA